MDYLLIAAMIYLVGVCVAWFDEYYYCMRFYESIHGQYISRSHGAACEMAFEQSWLSWLTVWTNSGE